MLDFFKSWAGVNILGDPQFGLPSPPHYVPRLRFFGNNSISHLFFKVLRWNLAERHNFMYEPKLYILIQEIFSTAHARARFLLLKNRYIQGNLNNNVNSSDFMTIFFCKSRIRFYKMKFQSYIKIGARICARARAHWQNNTLFQGKTFIFGFFEITFK